MRLGAGFNDLPSEQISAQVERVASSSEFRRSTRMVRFLRLIVERTLSGKAESLKEYVIGTEVFDRGPTFDPCLDSIVRVEARRLREKLAAYYRGEGCNDVIIIELRAGSYVPLFHIGSRTAVEDTRSAQLCAAEPIHGTRAWGQLQRLNYLTEIRLRIAEEKWWAAQLELDRIAAEMRAGEKTPGELITSLLAAARKARAAHEEYRAAVRDCSTPLEMPGVRSSPISPLDELKGVDIGAATPETDRVTSAITGTQITK